jgi:hypothetical protein
MAGEVKLALEKLGAALSDGDAKAVAQFWALPGLVLSDQGAIVVNAAAEIEQFFTKSIASYRENGIYSTRPDLRASELLSDTLAWADVEWPGIDANGKEVSRERSFYILRIGDDGSARIQVALSRTR